MHLLLTKLGSGLPPHAEGTSQDPQRVPETANSVSPYVYTMFSPDRHNIFI